MASRKALSASTALSANMTAEEEEVSRLASKYRRRLDRKAAAAAVSQEFFPVSPRTLERWPLPWQRPNGRALVETTALFAEAQRRLQSSPQIAA